MWTDFDSRAAFGSVILGAMLAASSLSNAQVAEPIGLQPLVATRTPLPDLKGVVVDTQAALQLGKALFWDINVGSDGMACASCHFAAGTDTRINNQISTGIKDQRYATGDRAFGALTRNSLPAMTPQAQAVMQQWLGDLSPVATAGKTAGGQVAAPGVTLAATDFPTHKLKNVADRNSAILYTTNDAISSQGVTPSTLQAIDAQGEICTPDLDSQYVERTETGALVLRAVEPRNSPSTVNAGFHKRNFWDGRANNSFNGTDPFGQRSPASGAVVYNSANNTLRLQRLDLENGNLASQAVGPPLSHIEMSCGGKTFPMLGRKLLAMPVLRDQGIHPTDSVLGAWSAAARPTYMDMVRRAFDAKYWPAPAQVRVLRNAQGIVDSNAGFTQPEINFPLFFGIAVMMYESTLVSGQTPLDKDLGGIGPRMLTATERAGKAVFQGKGKCVNCHAGPILSKGTVAEVEFMVVGDGGKAFYDGSFYNIGMKPTVADIGLGGTDPWGNPLSYTRQLLTNRIFDRFNANLCNAEVVPFAFTGTCDTQLQLQQLATSAASQRVTIDGSFQTPTLRNIGLTPPYFHDGSVKSLEELVDVYNRGGNARGPIGNDTSGTGAQGRPLGTGDLVGSYRRGSNLDADIVSLKLTTTEKAQLVAFLKALTDDRVSCDAAPFDHPSLPIPRAGNTLPEFTLPATGAAGLKAIGKTCRPNSGNLFTEYAHLSGFKN